MKRAFLIAGGTVGGLGAVLAITPPQLTASQSNLGAGLELAPAANTAEPAATQSPVAKASPAPSAGKNTNGGANTNVKVGATAKPSATQSAAAKPSATATATPTATATKSAEPTPVATKATSSKSTSGSFIGDPYTMRYGTVQVQITISGGKITDAQAIQAPSGRDQRYTDMAVPVMRQKTLAAQSANITGVSGASYTAYAWYISLQSALKKAGWM